MRWRDLRRLADPTPTRAERRAELDRIAALLQEIGDDRSVRGRWRRLELLAWRDRLLAAVPEPHEPEDGDGDRDTATAAARVDSRLSESDGPPPADPAAAGEGDGGAEPSAERERPDPPDSEEPPDPPDPRAPPSGGAIPEPLRQPMPVHHRPRRRPPRPPRTCR